MIGAAFIGPTLVTPLYTLYQHEFGFSKLTLTLVYATFVVGNLLALLFFGRISDQIGRRKVCVIALGFGTGSALLFLFARNVAWLYAGRLFIGFAVGMAAGAGTAWLAELYPARERSTATVMATASNMTGIAIGPLLGGVAAQYAPHPLQLPFLVDIATLMIAGLFILCWPPETVRISVRRARDLDLRPRVGIPPKIRPRFIAPSVCGFASFALAGFYFALIPSVLSESLHNGSVAVAGAVVFEMVAVTVVVLVFARGLSSHAAMFGGLIVLLPSVGLLVAAELLASMPLLLIASVFAGASLALGYRGGLQVVNEIAPDDRRAEVVSSYFVACFSGNSVPVIGVGIVATLYNSMVAGVALACAVALLSLSAIIIGIRYL
jgi:MFS family permease